MSVLFPAQFTVLSMELFLCLLDTCNIDKIQWSKCAWNISIFSFCDLKWSFLAYSSIFCLLIAWNNNVAEQRCQRTGNNRSVAKSRHVILCTAFILMHFACVCCNWPCHWNKLWEKGREGKRITCINNFNIRYNIMYWLIKSMWLQDVFMNSIEEKIINLRW